MYTGEQQRRFKRQWKTYYSEDFFKMSTHFYAVRNSQNVLAKKLTCDFGREKKQKSKHRNGNRLVGREDFWPLCENLKKKNLR